MAGKKKRPGRSYQRPNYGREAQDHAWSTYADNVQPETLHISPNPPSAPIHKDPPAPAHTHVTHPSAAAPRASGGRGRYLVPIAAGGAAVGGAGYLMHRRRRNVGKSLVDPLTGTSVVLEKRYLEDDVNEAPRGALVAKAGPDDSRPRSKSRERATHARRLLVADPRFGINPMNQQNREWRRHWKTNAGYTGGGLAAGSAAGAGAAHLGGKSKLVGAAVGGITGELTGATIARHKIIRRMEANGTLKKALTVPPQSASFSQGHTWEREGTSHANRLSHTRHKPRQKPRGALLQIKHGGRSVSGSSIGKSAAYSQSGSSGRRIVSAY